jgi:hypothetical protein
VWSIRYGAGTGLADHSEAFRGRMYRVPLRRAGHLATWVHFDGTAVVNIAPA